MILLLLWYMLSSYNYYAIAAGHVGVEINTHSEEVNPNQFNMFTSGYINSDMSIVEYPVHVRSATLNQIDFMSSDHLRFEANVLVSYQLDPEKAPLFYKVFREKNLDKFDQGHLFSFVHEQFKEAGKKYSSSQIIDSPALLMDVRDTLQDTMKPYGIHIVQFGFLGPLISTQYTGQ